MVFGSKRSKKNLQNSNSDSAPTKSQNTSPSRSKGDIFERQAEQYLTQQGLTLVMRNYWCKLGEIDLIMRHHNTLVFVEVRYRNNANFGGAAASVTPAKQQKLRRAALCYLQAHQLNEAQQSCRFDLIACEGEQLHWIENAF